jgi:hypothetical protein
MKNDSLKNSVDTLKIIYMVVAGLAIADGLEFNFINESRQFVLPNDASFWILFTIFVTTVGRFVHGAIRHFDISYNEHPEKKQYKVQPIVDFISLGLEAFIFFILAFSLKSTNQFIIWYLALLSIDSIWLLVYSIRNISLIYKNSTCRNWMCANIVVIVSITFVIILHSPTYVFFIFAILHTIVDYPLNWEFYFGEPLFTKNKQTTAISPTNSIIASQPTQITTLFIAGAYTGRCFNEIEENIRVAEKHSIALWNLGYKVFCPHLNTRHFEVKTIGVTENDYKSFDLFMLKACDAVFVLPNWEQSSGAQYEIQEAKKLGKPVYYELDEMPNIKS